MKALITTAILVICVTVSAAAAPGSIVGWGWNLYGQCNAPSPNIGFTAVAGGGGHSLGLKSDGSIVAWGYNKWGQSNVPSDNTGFIAISAGDDYNLGLKSDGSIVAWGANEMGQCILPLSNTSFVAISAGGRHGLGLLQPVPEPSSILILGSGIISLGFLIRRKKG